MKLLFYASVALRAVILRPLEAFKRLRLAVSEGLRAAREGEPMPQLPEIEIRGIEIDIREAHVSPQITAGDVINDEAGEEEG